MLAVALVQSLVEELGCLKPLGSKKQTKQNIVSGIITNLEIKYASFVYKL